MPKLVKRLVKHAIYLILYYSGLLRLLVSYFSMKKSQHRGAILFYHRFCKKSEVTVELLPRLDCKEFDRQLEYLKKTYEIISLDDAASLIRQGEGFRRPSIILSIDDGYKDNYSLAYPIIRKHGLPFTIYLTAGMIGTRKGLWIDDIEYALQSSDIKSFTFEKLLGADQIDISTLEGKKIAEKKLYVELVKKGQQVREDALRELFSALNISETAFSDRERIMMNWEEIHEMSTGGIDFGAHTVSHPCLSALPPDEAKKEMLDSKRIIEEMTGATVRHFAIPNGKADDFSTDLKKICMENGFDTVVTTEPGVISVSSDPYALERILPPPPLYYFACELARYFFRGIV